MLRVRFLLPLPFKELKIMSNKAILTLEGYFFLKREIELLEKVNSSLAYNLNLARLDGDISENADLLLLQKKKREIFFELSEKRNLLERAEIQQKSEKNDYIEIGKIVVYELLENYQKITIELTDEIYADPVRGKVSSTSPLGTLLIGKKIGDVLEIKGEKQYKIRVLEIK